MMVNSLKILMLVASDSMLSNISGDKFMSLNVPVDSYANLESSYFFRNAPRDISEFAHKIIKGKCIITAHLKNTTY